MKIKQLFLSLFLLVSFAIPASAQIVRDLAEPVMVTVPLSDPQDATRLFYLRLANMPQSDLNVTLKKAGLSNVEILTVKATVAAFKATHDTNASAFQSLAMRTNNSTSDLASYVSQDNALLQQAITNLAGLSIQSQKALNTLAGQSYNTVKQFTLEIPSPMPVSASNRAKLTPASYKAPIPTCPKGSGGPYQIYDISGALSTSLSLSSSDDVNFTLTSVGNGTYTVTYQNAYTCTEAKADVFHIKQVGTFTGAPGFNGSGATSSDFCGHPGSGSFNLSSVTNTTNFTNPTNVSGTIDWQLIDVIAGVSEVLVDNKDYIAGFYEHTQTIGSSGCPGLFCVATEAPLCYPAQHSLNVVAIHVPDGNIPPLTRPAPQYDNYAVGFRFTAPGGTWYWVEPILANVSLDGTTHACTYIP